MQELLDFLAQAARLEVANNLVTPDDGELHGIGPLLDTRINIHVLEFGRKADRRLFRRRRPPLGDSDFLLQQPGVRAGDHFPGGRGDGHRGEPGIFEGLHIHLKSLILVARGRDLLLRHLADGQKP